MASPSTANAKPEQTLVSWKEIAAYLNRAERTVKRWERERGLPVHRVPGGERGGVYAYPSELSVWLRGKSGELEAEDAATGEAADPLTVESVTEAVPTPAEPAAGGSPSVPRRTISAARLTAWLLPLGLTAILIVYFSFSGGHGASPVTAVGDREANGDLTPDSVAVLPFVNAGGDASSDYLCDGLTESLIGNLVHVPDLKVRSRDAVFRLKSKDLAVQQAGSELGVQKIVSGRVTAQGNRIEIRAEITDVRDNTEVWGKHYTGKSSDLLQMQKQIAGDLAQELRSSLSTAEREQVTRQGTQDPEAYRLYLRGRYAWNLRDRARLESAIASFNQAIEKDPEYALAYSGLADAYSVLPNFGGDPNEDFPRSNAAARKALELDPTLARPHAVLGANLTEYTWDFAGGEAEFRKAIALDANDATAHQWYAEELSQIGRHSEAWAEINRAHDLDPLSPVITRVMGGTLLDAGQADRSLQVCKQLVQENPTFPVGHDCLYFAYWKKHMYSQAVEEYTIESRLTGNPDDIELTTAMEQGFHRSGWSGALASGAAVLEARREKSYVSPFIIARLHADMGEKDKAFQWLNMALLERDRLLIGLNVSPGFDKIRADPRFAELVRKVGLPPLQ